MSNAASRVLVVDDAPVNRTLLTSMLESYGVSADQAENGQQCLQMCEQNNYELILLDHLMPDFDGVETLLHLKELFIRKGIEVPVVCHTTEDAYEILELYKTVGFADVILKPIQPQILGKILATYLPDVADPASLE